MGAGDVYNSYNSLPAAFLTTAEQHPERTCYKQAVIGPQDDLNKPREWREVTFAACRERVLKLAQFLKQSGVQKGSHVAILSNTRPEWMEADLAILSCGGVVISVYQTLPDSDVAYILFDSETRYVFVENQEQLDKLTAIEGRSIEMAGTEDRQPTTAALSFDKIISFEKTEGHPSVVWVEDIFSGPEAAVPAVVETIGRDDLASFVYTSGTTGPPKGVVQSHGNHLSNVRQALNTTVFPLETSILLFLPLAHSFAKLVGYLGFLTPAYILFAGTPSKKNSQLVPESITKDIREANAQIIPIVPRLLEKMAGKIRDKAKEGGIKGFLLGVTLRAAKENYNAEKKGEHVGLMWRIAYDGTKGLRKKIRAQLFGNDFDYIVSGGAKLLPSIAEFFDALGIEILEGYGLTETCVATNVNRPGQKKIGSVGPLLDRDIEIRIDADGEISFRGPNVAHGYYKRPTATNRAWDDEGWFRTGDLGSIDDDGFLSIKGRKKEIIVTSAGKNIAPTKIEDLLKKSPYVSQVVAIGDTRAHIGALITIEEANLKRWAKSKNVKLTEPLHEDEQVRALFQQEIDRANKELANYERINVFAVLPGDFTVENGLLTPTMKVKRGLINERYKEIIEDLYQE